MSAPGGYDTQVYSRSVIIVRVYQNEQAPGFSPGMLLLWIRKQIGLSVHEDCVFSSRKSSILVFGFVRMNNENDLHLRFMKF